jgi:hypothetical protein
MRILDRILTFSRDLTVRLALAGAILLYASACNKPVEVADDYTHIDPATLKKGDTIMPFRFLHPEVGDWKVEVRISGDDLHDVSHKITSRKFTATEPRLLLRFRKLRFIYGQGRTHKPSSTLRVYDDVHLYEQHGIVFEKNYLAFQSKRYGIMTCIDEEEFFNLLEDMY